MQGAPIRRIRPRQSNRPHGSEAHSANEPPQAGIGRASASACCARRKESPNPSYSGWSARAQELRARDSRHRAASAGLFGPAGEPANRGTLRAVRMGCVCSARLQRLPATWNSATPQWRVRAVPSAPRAIRSRLQPTQMLQAAMGRPTMTAAGSRSAASARSVSIGSTMGAPSYAIDHQWSKPSP